MFVIVVFQFLRLLSMFNGQVDLGEPVSEDTFPHSHPVFVVIIQHL